MILFGDIVGALNKIRETVQNALGPLANISGLTLADIEQFGIDFGIQIAATIILFIVVAIFFWKPITKILEARRDQRDKELNEAIIKNNIGRYGIGINIKEGNTFKYVIGGKYMGGPIPRGLKIITFDACKAIKFNGFGQFPTAVESLHYEITHRWIYNHSNMIFDYKYQAIIFTKIDEVNYNISIIIPLKNNE